MNRGKLYAVGVGPGAPDLLTLRAVKILGSVPVILAAASSKNEASLAVSIARPHLNADARIIRLDFPMTRNKTLLKEAWGKAAGQTLAFLNEGCDCAFLTLGDPLIYSTFCYLMRTLKKLEPEIVMEAIPGITSFQAAAARALFPLCEGRQNLRIASGIGNEEDLLRELQSVDPCAILKVYRNYKAIRNALSDSGRLKSAILASFVEREGESIRPFQGEEQPPYMSLILCPAEDSSDQGNEM